MTIMVPDGLLVADIHMFSGINDTSTPQIAVEALPAIVPWRTLLIRRFYASSRLLLPPFLLLPFSPSCFYIQSHKYMYKYMYPSYPPASEIGTSDCMYHGEHQRERVCVCVCAALGLFAFHLAATKYKAKCFWSIFLERGGGGGKGKRQCKIYKPVLMYGHRTDRPVYRLADR